MPNNFRSGKFVRPSLAPCRPGGSEVHVVQGCATVEEAYVGFGGVFPLHVVCSYSESLKRLNMSILTPQQAASECCYRVMLAHGASLVRECLRPGVAAGLRGLWGEAGVGTARSGWFQQVLVASQLGTAQPLSPASGSSRKRV